MFLEKILLGDHGAFHFEQPFLGLQSFTAAVAMEFTICADHTMTGDHERHGVGRVRAAHRSISIRSANLDGDIVIRACFAIRDTKDYLQCITLEWPEECPVNGNGEGVSFST